jgi:hypothetical protein
MRAEYVVVNKDDVMQRVPKAACAKIVREDEQPLTVSLGCYALPRTLV